MRKRIGIFGATDEEAFSAVDQPLTMADLNATIGHALGLPLERRFNSPSGRPFTVAHEGAAIRELFG